MTAENPVDLSRIEAGRMPIRVVPVALPALVGEAVKVMQPMAASRGTELLVTTRALDVGSMTPDRDQLIRVQIPRLFRLFSGLGTEGRTEDGTGLGLAISRALVEQLDGRIWVGPAWPTGARFVVELPTAARTITSDQAGVVAGTR